MEDEISALKQEISQLKMQLKETSVEATKYRTLFNVSADALAIIDINSGRFIEAN